MRIGIVGCGAGSIFATLELGKTFGNDIEIKIYEQGPEVDERSCPNKKGYACAECSPCRIMSGVGGAGTFSSGILNLDGKIGGDLEDYCKKAKLDVGKVITEIDEFFLKSGAPKRVFDPYENKEKLKDLRKRSIAVDARFIPVRQRLLGSDKTPLVIKNMINFLTKEYNIELFSNTKVHSIDKKRNLIFEDDSKEMFDHLLIAPGRWGMVWLANECKKLGIKAFYSPLDIGVRVEVPSIIMEEVCKIQRDPKFHIITPSYNDFIRTFCVNYKGYVVKETYEEGIVGVNGHQLKIDGKSENTNFAFLIRQNLTSPLEDTTEYGLSISKQTSVLGGYKPLIQTLGDLRRGHRSREAIIKRNPVQPSLKNVTPGDIAMAYPYRFVKDILEGLEILDHIIPGVNNRSTLLYAPEFKRSAKRIETNEFFESMTVKNIFFAGDGAGLSRGIIGAAVTGIIAAKGIAGKIKS